LKRNFFVKSFFLSFSFFIYALREGLYYILLIAQAWVNTSIIKTDKNSSMMLNFGIISTARINHNAMLLPASKRDDVFIKAIASRDLDKAKEYANAWNIPTFYGSYEEILQDPTLDAVYISTPNALHVPWVKEALLKNKHVLCEKPFAPTYMDTLSLIKLAKSKGLLLMEGIHYNYHPAVQKVINELQDGYLGEIESVFTQLGITTPMDDDIRYQRELMGGSFMHLGCYCLHFIQNILNVPLTLSNILVERREEEEADIESVGNLKSEKTEGKFFFKATFKDSQLNSFAKIQGTRGNLTIFSPFNPVYQKGKRFIDIIKINSKGIRDFQLPPNLFGQSCYDFQLEAFVKAIKKGDLKPRVDERTAALIEQGQMIMKADDYESKDRMLLAS